MTLFRGICVTNVDPSGLNRIRFTCPQVFGSTTAKSTWALPCFPVAGPRDLPNPNDQVWVTFEGDDLNFPVWLGVLT